MKLKYVYLGTKHFKIHTQKGFKVHENYMLKLHSCQNSFASK